MKITFYLKDAWEQEYVQSRMPDVQIEFRQGELSGSDANALSIFMDHNVGENELALFPNLKLIITRSTGFDNIDLAAAANRNITVTNVPSYGVHTVAEFAAALMLALSRRVISAHARLATEEKYSQEGLEGIDLFGKTVGIVGTGRIGAHFAQIAHGLGMTILAHDQFENAELVEKLGVTYVPLPDLLARADFVSIHVPNTPQTQHLFNAEMFSHMKRGAYLINTARGAVVDTQALIGALDQGILAGAALDVQEDETASPATIALSKRPNVIVTPHIAFDTIEAKRRILDTTIENITSFAAGSTKNVVKPTSA
jgi:D-lactate dehydrogenase